MSVANNKKTRPARLTLTNCLTGAVASALIAAGAPAFAEETLVPIAAITLPNGQKITSFDISYVNSQLGIYVLGDRTSKAVDVVNTKTNTLIYQAGQGAFVGPFIDPSTGKVNNNKSGPDGVLIVNNKEIWAGDGNSTMKVLSLFNGALAYTIPTGGTTRVDEMCLDPVHGVVMAANNAEDPPFATFFSTRTKQVLGQVKFDGTNGTLKATNGAEQCQWSPRTQKFYITLPGVHSPDDGTGAVVEIDPVSRAVISNVVLPVTSCSAPQGMAIGPNHQILIGCNGGPLSAANGDPVAIIDDGSGAPFGTIIATVLHEVGADMVDYNSATGHYTLARSTAYDATSPQSIGIIDALTFVTDPDLTSGAHGGGGNHSIASDPVTNQYYFPVASTSGSTLCSSVGGIDAQGCILVLKTAGADSDNGDNPVPVNSSAPACSAQGAPVIQVGKDGPRVLTGSCK